MADRERDREPARRFRCSDCKSELVRGKVHTCPSCIVCGSILPVNVLHRCEPWEQEDVDTQQITADIERIVAAAQKQSADSARPTPR